MQTEIIDPLNLKGFLSLTTSFIKEKYASEPSTVLFFLNSTFHGIVDEQDKNSAQIIDFQKMCSGDTISKRAKPLIDKVCSGSLDKKLLNNFKCMLANINTGSKSIDELFFELSSKMDRRFFSDEEYEELRQMLSQKAYSSFLLAIFKHGLSTLHNLPQFLMQRVYEEATTYDFDNPVRFEMFKLAADSGHKLSALEYANYLSKKYPGKSLNAEKVNTALEYTLKAFPLPNALWNISYNLEQVDERAYNHEQVLRIQNSINLDELLLSVNAPMDEFHAFDYKDSENSAVREKCLLSFKICFYLAHTGFMKAYNSLGKYCDPVYGFLRLTESGEELFGSCENASNYYYRKAIAGGNVLAMCNVGSKLLKQMRQRKAEGLFDKSSPDVSFMLEIMRISSDAKLSRSSVNLGDYYIEFEKDRARAKTYYERAKEAELTSDICLRLASVSDSEQEQLEYYRQSVDLGGADAAYHLAVIYCEQYRKTGDRTLLDYAQRKVEERIEFMSASVQERSRDLLGDLRMIKSSVTTST